MTTSFTVTKLRLGLQEAVNNHRREYCLHHANWDTFSGMFLDRPEHFTPGLEKVLEFVEYYRQAHTGLKLVFLVSKAKTSPRAAVWVTCDNPRFDIDDDEYLDGIRFHVNGNQLQTQHYKHTPEQDNVQWMQITQWDIPNTQQEATDMNTPYQNPVYVYVADRLHQAINSPEPDLKTVDMFQNLYKALTANLSDPLDDRLAPFAELIAKEPHRVQIQHTAMASCGVKLAAKELSPVHIMADHLNSCLVIHQVTPYSSTDSNLYGANMFDNDQSQRGQWGGYNGSVSSQATIQAFRPTSFPRLIEALGTHLHQQPRPQQPTANFWSQSPLVAPKYGHRASHQAQLAEKPLAVVYMGVSDIDGYYEEILSRLYQSQYKVVVLQNDESEDYFEVLHRATLSIAVLSLNLEELEQHCTALKEHSEKGLHLVLSTGDLGIPSYLV